jgi:hypothetical protein
LSNLFFLAFSRHTNDKYRQVMNSRWCVLSLGVVLAASLASRAQTSVSHVPVKDDYSQEAAVVEEMSTKVAFDNDGNSTREQITRVRVQTDAGVKQWGLLTFPARWTRDICDLAARASLHVVFHAGLLLGVLPVLLVTCGGGNWNAPFNRTSFLNKLHLQLLFVPAVLVISSVQEFARRGRGTPMPADPPPRMVTSGTYAYIANPLQLGKFLMVAGGGVLVESVDGCRGVFRVAV